MRDSADGLDILRRRADFVAATAHAVKIGGPLIGLQLRDRGETTARPRVGFTVTKRVGDAVERNRMKRRLRVAVRMALAEAARPGCDYVLVARRALLDARFDRIVRDLRDAVRRAHGRSDRGERYGPGQTRQDAVTAASLADATPPAAGQRESGR